MSYKIHVKPSGQDFIAKPGESILDAALRSGYAIPYECRNGFCGSCKGKVLEGAVTYLVPPLGAAAGLEADEALFCQASPQSDLVLEVHEVRRSAAKPPVKKSPARVVKMERLAHNVMRIFLKLPENEEFEYFPGQYLRFLLPDGGGRAFSIANFPREDKLLEFHIRRMENGKFTGHVFNTMKEKDILRFEGPLGDFFLRENTGRPLVLVAGGTGFAPIKGIIEHARARGDERPMHLYWGVRAKRDLYLHDLAQEWTERYPGFRYTPVLSEQQADDRWTGRTGFVHQAVLDDMPDLSGFEVYTAGPSVMVYAVRDGFISRGLHKDNFYHDVFE